MIKQILAFFIFFILVNSIVCGQVQTFKVRKTDTAYCGFKFIAGPALMDKFYKLSVFKFVSTNNFKKKVADEIRSKLRLIKEKQYCINKFYFDSLVKDVCLVNKFKLTQIEIKPYGDTNHIGIIFTYKMAKKN